MNSALKNLQITYLTYYYCKPRHVTRFLKTFQNRVFNCICKTRRVKRCLQHLQHANRVCRSNGQGLEINQHVFRARPRPVPHFCCARAHIGPFEPWGTKIKGKRTPRTNGDGSRPGRDTDWQFRLKDIKDARALRPSPDRVRSWHTRKDGPSSFSTTVLILEKNDYNTPRSLPHPVLRTY